MSETKFCPQNPHLSPEGEFSMPINFRPEHYEPLKKFGSKRQVNEAFPPPDDNMLFRFSPIELVANYAETPVGRWQSLQQARYPGLHVDMSPRLVGLNEEDDPQLSRLKNASIGLLRPMTAPSGEIQKTTNQLLDLHPVGHHACTLVALDGLFFEERFWKILEKRDKIDTDLVAATRNAMALHDTGEATFPGFLHHHGFVVGDIGADKGKKSQDREAEEIIMRDVLEYAYKDCYDEDSVETIAKLIAHKTDKMDDGERFYHEIFQMAHDINSVLTAFQLAKISKNHQNKCPEVTNLMLAVAIDSVDRAHKAIEELSRTLESGLVDYLERPTKKLEERAYRVAQEKPGFFEWRNSDAVVPFYGNKECIPR